MVIFKVIANSCLYKPNSVELMYLVGDIDNFSRVTITIKNHATALKLQLLACYFYPIFCG